MNDHQQCSSIQQFKSLVELKDYRPGTKSQYIGSVVRLSKHFQADPATLSQEQVREYFLFLRQTKQYGANALGVVRAALRCFFREHLTVGLAWTVFEQVRIGPRHSLPLVLSRQEVAAVLRAVRQPRFVVCLRLIYHCGLRVSEAVRLQVRDIDGAQLRLRVCDGKGRSDRLVPMSAGMLQELRQFWKTHRDPQWLFPSPGQGRSARSSPNPLPAAAASPMGLTSVQGVFRSARKEAGIDLRATVHTLRHSYATHLLEEGVSLRFIAQYLGHRSLNTTLIYTHLTATTEAHTRAALDKLHQATLA